jgi:hypothetical protein
MAFSSKRLIPRGLTYFAAVFCASTVFAPSARAAFHLWNITEVYTNSSGTLQFIELRDSSGGQNSVNSHQIQVTNLSSTQTNTFVIPGNSLPGSTLGHALLFGTAGIQAAGGPAPDYPIPNGFLFSAGGTISFFGQNGGPYTQLPTDGLLSRTWNGGDALNTPENFAGQTGTVNGVPEPSTLILTSLGAVLCGMVRRRSLRRATDSHPDEP